MVELWRWSSCRGGRVMEVVELLRWSSYRGGQVIEVIGL